MNELNPDKILEEEIQRIINESDEDFSEFLSGEAQNSGKKSKKTGTEDSSRKEDATNVQFV